MMKSKTNSQIKRLFASLLALCMLLCLLPGMAMAAPEAPEFYTITVGEYSHASIVVDYQEVTGRMTNSNLGPGESIQVKPNSWMFITVTPDKNYFIASALYTMSGDEVVLADRDERGRIKHTVRKVTGDITLDVRMEEMFSITVPEFENGQISYTQNNVTVDLKSGETLEHVINPTVGAILTFTADPGYLVGSGTYCLSGDTEVHLGFNGESGTEQVWLVEENGFVGDITVYPEFVPIVGEGEFAITAGSFENAVVTLTQTIDGETTSRTLQPDEIYGIGADTDVTITIHPAPNYCMYYGSVTVGGVRKYLTGNSTGGKAVTTTIKVTGDTLISFTLYPARPSAYDRLYRVEVDDSGPGFVIRDHVTAYVRETVTLTIKPDTGYEVDTVTVTTYNGQIVPVRYMGINPNNNGRVFVFTMPQDSVKVNVTYARIK